MLQEIEQIGLEPNVVTFNNLIDACANKGREKPGVNRVSKILKLMKTRGLKPDEVTMKLAFGVCPSEKDRVLLRQQFTQADTRARTDTHYYEAALYLEPVAAS